jgi:hypothetical protein
MNKVDLVFDFSNMAMRALFTCNYAGGSQVSTFDTDEECGVLIRKIAMDMAYVMRIFTPDRVIIACDARYPWRNKLYEDIDDESYKGNRQKDTTKNWTKIFEALNDYKKILEEKGFIVSEIPTAEADDLAALWKKNAFDNKNNIVLISSDKDWTQLIEFKNNNFCICFNPIANNKGAKKLSVTEDLLNWINTTTAEKVDIFFSNYNSYKDTLSHISSKDSKIKFDIVSPQLVVLDKILCGDDGDNAPTFYEYYKDGKKNRMTPSRAKKLYETLNVTTVKDLCEVAETNSLLECLEKIFKKKLDDIDIKERLLRQRKLVELNPDLFPKDIISGFSYQVKDAIYSVQNTSSIKLDDILKDTKFLDENYVKKGKAKENSIFDNLKNLEIYIGTPQTSTSLF